MDISSSTSSIQQTTIAGDSTRGEIPQFSSELQLKMQKVRSKTMVMTEEGIFPKTEITGMKDGRWTVSKDSALQKISYDFK